MIFYLSLSTALCVLLLLLTVGYGKEVRWSNLALVFLFSPFIAFGLALHYYLEVSALLGRALHFVNDRVDAAISALLDA